MHADELSLENLLCRSIGLLEQGITLVNSVEDTLYQQRISPVFEGSIGSHVRHITDFYECLLAGLRSGVVNYNQRTRDQAVERHRATGLLRFRRLIEHLATLNSGLGSMPLLVQWEDDFGAQDVSWSNSSLSRELEFLRSHTVHHYAIIAIMGKMMGIDPGREFGVASSTQVFHRGGDTACAGISRHGVGSESVDPGTSGWKEA